MTKKIQSIINLEERTLTIKTEGKPDLIFNADNVIANIQLHCILHGAKQKIVDSASLPSGATITEKYLAMCETFDRITGQDGTWNKQGEGSGQPSGLLFKALCRLYTNKTPESLRAWLDKQDKAQQAALRKNPKIAPIIEQIKSESVNTAGIDSDGLLAGLDEI